MLVLHRSRSSASYFNFHYPRVSLRSPSSWLRLLPRLLFTSLLPCIFPPITCFRRQFLLKLWPIQLAFLLLAVRRIFLSSLTLCNTVLFLTQSVQLIASILLQHYISYHKYCEINGAVSCTNFFLIIQVRPGNQVTIKVVVFCHKKFGRPWSTTVVSTQWIPGENAAPV